MVCDTQSSNAVIDWLLSGDTAITYQTRRDLLGDDQPTLQNTITQHGWAKRLLSHRGSDGFWPGGFYQTKWTSTHDSLLDLRTLQIAPDTPGVEDCILQIIDTHRTVDGGIAHTPGYQKSDICLNGSFLNYACYFGVAEQQLQPLVDFLLSGQLADGGFNCRFNRSGARHSSLHSTLAVLEGFLEYKRAGHSYQIEAIKRAIAASEAFILQHRFYRSDRTGKVIKPAFLRMPYPRRWHYTTARALDYWAKAGKPYDPRMNDALAVLSDHQRPDGRWPRHAALPGKTHNPPSSPRAPSRWNTLVALRIQKAYPSRSNTDL